MLRQGRFKQIWHSGADVDLLYDMENDPGETRNLGDDPAYKELLMQNREILRALMDKATPDMWIQAPEPEQQTSEDAVDPLTGRPRSRS